MPTYRYCPLCSHGQPSTDGDVCARCGENMNSATMPEPMGDFSMSDFTNRMLCNMGHLQSGGLLPPMKKVQS